MGSSDTNHETSENDGKDKSKIAEVPMKENRNTLGETPIKNSKNKSEVPAESQKKNAEMEIKDSDIDKSPVEAKKENIVNQRETTAKEHNKLQDESSNENASKTKIPTANSKVSQEVALESHEDKTKTTKSSESNIKIVKGSNTKDSYIALTPNQSNTDVNFKTKEFSTPTDKKVSIENGSQSKVG